MDQGTEFGADLQQLCQSRGISPVVTDLETPWQNSVVERHGSLYKMAPEKARSLEPPATEAEIDEHSIDVWDALDLRPANEFFGRQLRLPSSLLEDDFIDPNMIAQNANHEMRRSEAMRMAAAHECVVARAMTTAAIVDVENHSWCWWLENPCSYTDGRMEPKDGVDLACAS